MKISRNNLLFFFASLIALSSCFEETFIPVEADFSFSFQNGSSASPAVVDFISQTTGADTYEWAFEGGQPATSSEVNPQGIKFEAEGIYTVKLTASNQDGLREIVEYQVNVGTPLKASFEIKTDAILAAPLLIEFINTSTGAERYEWEFEGAEMSASTQESPTVTFTDKGTHTVRLKAFSGNRFTTFDTTITVSSALIPKAGINVAEFNPNLESPLLLQLSNNSEGATSFRWEVNGADFQLASTTDSVTNLSIKKAGNYEVKLIASNGRSEQSFDTTLVVNEPTNLLEIRNLKIGIDETSPHPFIVSTYNGVGVNASDIGKYDAKELDLVFFARDNSFSYSRFVSPDKSEEVLLPNIPEALSTSYVNLLERCANCSDVTESVFESINNAADLSNLTFTFNDDVIEGFDKSNTPRFIPFLTSSGRSGIIKINSFSTDTTDPHIEVDIKVMRFGNL